VSRLVLDPGRLREVVVFHDAGEARSALDDCDDVCATLYRADALGNAESLLTSGGRWSLTNWQELPFKVGDTLRAR
jgi:hypothetical protein